MTWSYATDADLLARIPDASSVASGVRAAALDDARAMIELASYRDKSVRAHCMLAAHYIALDTGLLGGESGPVTAMSAGEISASFAVASTASAEDYARTRWGRAFAEITATVPHSPEAV